MSLSRLVLWSVLVLLGFSFSNRSACRGQEVIPGWHTNLREAQQVADATGKPMFITFRCVR